MALEEIAIGRDAPAKLVMRGIAKTFHGVRALDDVSFGNAAVTDINLDMRQGEIVSIAGLDGSGKSALARAIFGDEPFTQGAIQFGAQTAPFGAPRDAIAAGLGCLSDDRKRECLILQQSLRDNAALPLRGFAPALSSACNPRFAPITRIRP